MNQKKSPGRPRKQEGVDLKTHEHILQKAARLFIHNGFEQISLVQIATECQVTKATVYYYFTNKANLFTQAVSHQMNQIRGYVLVILQEQKPLRERLIDIAMGHLVNARTDFATMILNAKPFLTEEQLQEIRASEHGIHLVIAEAFQQAIMNGELAKRDAYLTANAFMSLLMVGHNELIRQRFANMYEIAVEIVDIFWQGASTKSG
ncbi:TetR/AcrR family transcriptional regulator [Paenibacillus eucommiae]|uniref:AcrR family transcriptional regulator n=1 Tax=Paenibacillus eucommiae TaxID=1355755 RepID=A0ABS4JCC8_9BACL|nr:TetR/AcrR family transcriptional regulator [Paenibacillus eucommiae]MBP1996886.1 AcrR family transcriptional regulator [Paenibacillus eucommiae]